MKPCCRIGGTQALADHAEHERIIDQLATIHGRLGLAAELAATGHRGTQQIAGGDLRNAETFDQALRLRAFARTGCSQQDDAHDGCACVRRGPPRRLATLPADPGEVKPRRDGPGIAPVTAGALFSGL